MKQDYAAIKEEDYPVIDDDVSAELPARTFEEEYNQQQSGEFVPLAPINVNETWFKTYWRPALAWQYLAVCLFDFIIAPSLTLWLYGNNGLEGYTQWQPLTLQATGFYHVAMGAVLGIAVWSRSLEKKNDG